MSPEFSRPQRIDALPPAGLDRRVEGQAAELEALARRMQVPAIESLACDWHLAPVSRDRVIAQGRLSARLTQVCVVTLDEFATTVDEEFTVHFVPAGKEQEDEDPESPDELPYEGAMIDLGEAAAEQLGLALDPYPRKPGAELPQTEMGEEHPFASLRKLKK
jgi:uncharacterized metal-binding protein YceD (DUF177 family)